MKLFNVFYWHKHKIVLSNDCLLNNIDDIGDFYRSYTVRSVVYWFVASAKTARNGDII